ncbi:MAG: ABC transporter permease [Candidatus Sumerlaeota bacterium]|nr:ABC transporter permease [Candidatus Sumerlaeota bacterium]
MRFLPIVFDNPLFVRELRRRMRGRGVIFTLIAYVLLMGAISFGVILVLGLRPDQAPQDIGQDIGRAIFASIAVIQAFLVWLAAPSITAGVTNAERERQTFEFLQVTTLTARSYIVGNLLSSVMYALIVLVCALPVTSVSFLYGGIGIDDVLTTFGVLLGLSLALCCFALFASAVWSKSRGVQAAVTMVCVMVGISMLSGGLIFISFSARGGTPFFLQPVTLGGLSVARWVTWALVGGLGCYALVAAAGRKLYTPDNRMFNYRQFLVFFLIAQALLLGSGWGSFGAKGAAEQWIGPTALLMFVAAALYSTGRVEVGDEVWILKRRHPFFRRVDDGLLFLALLAAAWVLGGAIWTLDKPSRAAGSPPAPSLVVPALRAIGYFSVASLFIFLLGKIVSQFTWSRRAAFWALIVVVGLLFCAFPLALGITEGSMLNGEALAFLSPVMALFHADLLSDKDLSLAAIVFYLAACAGAALVWAVARRRHREVNYHYELKA